MAGQMNWNLENGIDALWSKVRNKFGVLANKLPQSVLHSILRASPGFKIFMLVLLGFVLYGTPGGFVASQAYPWLYGLQYMVLFACVLVYGKGAAIRMLIALTFLNILFTEITLREIIGDGVPLERFAQNLAEANWLITVYGIIIAVCFILLFAFFTGLLNTKFSNKAFFVLAASHAFALTICFFGLTIIQTRHVNLPLAMIFRFSTVFWIIIGAFGVLFLKVLWSYSDRKSGSFEAKNGVASWGFCIAAFSVLAFAVPNTTLQINSLSVGNSAGGVMINEPGSTLQSSEMRFFTPVITLNSSREEEREVTFYVRIVNPYGTVIGADSPEGFTFSGTRTIEHGEQTVTLPGWGHADRSGYPAGVYTVEIWLNNGIFYQRLITERITIHE